MIEPQIMIGQGRQIYLIQFIAELGHESDKSCFFTFMVPVGKNRYLRGVLNSSCEGLNTECPKIYHKSILHLLKYTANLYLSRCSTYFR